MTEDWKKQAACRGMDIKIFFPDHNDVNLNSRFVWTLAKKVCESCAVKQKCLDYQLPFEEATCRRDGMWGGMTPTERRGYVYNGKQK